MILIKINTECVKPRLVRPSFLPSEIKLFLFNILNNCVNNYLNMK